MDGAGVNHADQCDEDSYAERSSGREAFKRSVFVAFQVSWTFGFGVCAFGLRMVCSVRLAVSR